MKEKKTWGKIAKQRKENNSKSKIQKKNVKRKILKRKREREKKSTTTTMALKSPSDYPPAKNMKR